MKLMLELSRIFNSMEVHTVNNLHNTAAILSSLQGAASVAAAASVANPSPSPSPKKTVANAGSASAKQSSTEAAILEQLSKQQQQQQQQVANLSRDCESPSSSNSELGQDFAELQDMNGSLTGSGSVGKSNGSLSGTSSTHSVPPGGSGAAAAVTGTGAANANANNCSSTNGTQPIAVIGAHLKKRISSSRTPTRKAHRIKFYRNGDRFYPGITIPVSNERYRSFESLYEDLTRLLEENVKIPGAVRAIYNMSGKKVSRIRSKT